MKNLLLLLFSIFQLHAFGCLNEYNINAKGEVNESYTGLPVFYRSFDVDYYSSIISKIDLNDTDNIEFKQLSDIGVALTKLGRYKEALNLFRALNKKHPNEYQIISNLGTLYELNGKVDSAYFFIKKGIEIDASSHQGSEWVHLKILEAKQKLKHNPEWLLSNQVLASQPTDTTEPFYPMKVEFNICYQLKERIPFTPDNDLLMANILSELGDILKEHISVENAYVAYKMAEHYDPGNQLKIKSHIESTRILLDKYDLNEPDLDDHFPDRSEFKEMVPSKGLGRLQTILLIGIITVLLFLIIIVLIMRKIRKSKLKP